MSITKTSDRKSFAKRLERIKTAIDIKEDAPKGLIMLGKNLNLTILLTKKTV